MNNNSNDGKLRSTILKNKKIIILATTGMLVVLMTVLGYFLSVKNKVDSWAYKVYPGVQAYGIDLGNKTKEEAIQTINEQLIPLISNKVINVNVGDKKFQLKYSDINPSVSAEVTVEQALEYGKDKDMFEKKKMIEDGVNYEVDTILSYDEEKVKEFANSVNENVKVNAVDAKISVSGSSISITPENIGKRINIDDLCNKIKDCIDPDPEKIEEVSVELEEYSPRITSKDLNKITGVMSSYSSTFGTADTGRVENLRIASGYINGTLLMPGDEFSYNNTIGPTTRSEERV